MSHRSKKHDLYYERQSRRESMKIIRFISVFIVCVLLVRLLVYMYHRL